MPGPYGDLVAGRIIVKTTLKSGDPTVIATLDGEDEGPEEDAYWHQPLGLRSRPRDKKANAVVSQDGNNPEVMNAYDPKLDLPGIDKGSTQLHSVGNSPQLIDVTDTKIKIGKDAGNDQNAARKGDNVGGGRIVSTAATKIVGTTTITTVLIQYFDIDNNAHTIFQAEFTPVTAILVPNPAAPTVINIKEEIIQGSSLTFIEGDPT